LESGVYHNVPLSPFHPATPISLAVQCDVILRKHNNKLPSVEGYCFIDQVQMTHWPILFACRTADSVQQKSRKNRHKHKYSQHNYTPHCFL